MPILFQAFVFLFLTFLFSPVFAGDAAAIRIIVMPYKLQGDLAGNKIDSEHQKRLYLADKTLRTGLQQTQRYDLVDVPASLEFSNQVTTALSNNACDRCEVALAKKLNAKQIVVPWVYRLSQLVLTMHFVVLDAESGKTVLKKALDFRGDNDQSWERAIRFFVKSVITK